MKRKSLLGLSAGVLSAGVLGIRKWQKGREQSRKNRHFYQTQFLEAYYVPALDCAIDELLAGKIRGPEFTKWLAVWNLMVGLGFLSSQWFQDQVNLTHYKARERVEHRVSIQVTWAVLKVRLYNTPPPVGFD